MQSIPGRFAAATVSTAAMALLLSLPSPPATADSSLEPTRVERVQSLLIEHDMRYVLQTERKLSGDCLPDAAEYER